jgi:hypothetical protein
MSDQLVTQMSIGALERELELLCHIRDMLIKQFLFSGEEQSEVVDMYQSRIMSIENEIFERTVLVKS